MRVLLFLGAVVFAIGCAGSAWTPISITSDQYTYAFPGRPAFSERTLENGNIMRSAKVQLDGCVLALHSFAVIPSSASQPSITLERVVDHLSQSGSVDGRVGFELVRSSEVQLGPFPGREVLMFEPGSTQEYRAKLLMVNDEFVQLAALGNLGACSSSDVEQFFGSVELMPLAHTRLWSSDVDP